MSRGLQCDRNTIHKNLVFCLFIAEVIFLLGIGQHEHKVSFTAVIDIFIHPFIANPLCACHLSTQLSIPQLIRSFTKSIKPCMHKSINSLIIHQSIYPSVHYYIQTFIQSTLTHPLLTRPPDFGIGVVGSPRHIIAPSNAQECEIRTLSKEVTFQK